MLCRFLSGRSDKWLENLRKQLEAIPQAGLGEVGTHDHFSVLFQCFCPAYALWVDSLWPVRSGKVVNHHARSCAHVHWQVKISSGQEGHDW